MVKIVKVGEIAILQLIILSTAELSQPLPFLTLWGTHVFPSSEGGLGDGATTPSLHFGSLHRGMKSKPPAGQWVCDIYLLSITISWVDCPTPILDVPNGVDGHEAWSSSLSVSHVDTCLGTLAVVTVSGLRIQFIQEQPFPWLIYRGMRLSTGPVELSDS